jgi:hypothetical protein
LSANWREENERKISGSERDSGDSWFWDSGGQAGKF